MYSCDKCNYFTNNKKDFRRHENTEKHKRNTKKIYTCEFCEKVFEVVSTYYYHRKKCKTDVIYQNIGAESEIINSLKLELIKKDYKIELLELKQENSNLLNKHLESLNELEKSKIIKPKRKSTKKLTVDEDVDMEPIIKTRMVKEKIPITVKNAVWYKYFGDITSGICKCCKSTPIHLTNFDCGHIISEYDGGKVHLDNLRPICRTCNSSMGTHNMDDYMIKYGFDKL